MKKFSYMLEAAALWLAFSIFRIMSADSASALGGWIGSMIGPRLAASRKARKNLVESFPDFSEARYDEIIHDMWNNLGRVIAEFPHLKKISYERTEIIGMEHLEKIGHDHSFIAIGGHLANWEVVHATINSRLDSASSYIVREPNNPYAAKILEKCRNFGHNGQYLPKSSSGTRALVKVLQQGGRIGILIDQKYNQGIPVDFFGRPAMTSTAVAALAQKFKVPILPFQMVRLKGNRLRLIIHPPMDIAGMDENAIMLKANQMLEGWICQHPGQWLWLHRRWNSKALQ